METEAPPIREDETSKVTASQVWQEFRKFEVRAQQGFLTQEERLGAYVAFIGEASTFFNYPEVKKSSSAQIKELVNGLFYHHEDHAALPIDFFVEATKRIKREVLDEGTTRPLGYRFRDEVDFIGKLMQQELLSATQAAKGEREDRLALEGLASKAVTSELDSFVEIDLSDTQHRQRKIKQVALDHLAKDPELRGDIERRDVYLGNIRELQTTTPTLEEIQQKLSPFKDFLQGQEAISSLDDLYLHIAAGHGSYVTTRLGELAQAAEDPDFIWKQWLEQGAVPTDLYNSFEQIATLAELAEVSHILSGMPKEIKAKYYIPYLGRGVSASLLREMAEGKFELPDDLIVQEVATFLDFYNAYEKETILKHKPWSTKRKVATALIVATVVATPFIYKMFQDHSGPGAIEQVLESIPPEELAGLEELGNEDEEGVTVLIEGGGMAGDGRGGPPGASGETRASPQESSYTVSSDFIRPENGSPEGLMEKQKRVLWNLEGMDLWGFYRTSSASRFEPYKKGWLVNRQYARGSQAAFSNRRDITLSTQTRIGSQIIELPTRSNYVPTLNSIQVEGILVGYGIYQTTDGNYFLNFAREDVGKNVSISYSLGKSGRSVTPRPSEIELQEMRRRYINVEDLPPGELKTFMQQLSNNKEYSPAVKAKLIEKYIKTNFLYSLDAKWSNEYHRQRDVKEFFRKIAELKRCDCDVANTALVMLLRTQNIPSRMVYGNAHTGGFLNPNEKQITAAESHGWAEAYIGGQWLSLDATPLNMDQYTEKALEGKVSPSQLEQIRERDQFMQEISSLQTWLEENVFIKTLLQLTGLNMAALATSILLRRRNNRVAEKLQKEVESRTSVYLGSSYPDIGWTFTQRERAKIDQSRTNGVNPLAVLPPFGFIGLWRDISRTSDINHLPYHQETPTIERTTEPNTVEYLAKVLGYNEKDVRRKLFTESYDIAKSHISYQIETLVYGFTNDGVIPDSFSRHIRKSVQKLTEPQDEQTWERTKSALTERLYQQYLTNRARGEKKQIREAAKYDEEPDIPPRISREEFESKMDELYRLRLVQLTIRGEFISALKSLQNS